MFRREIILRRSDPISVNYSIVFVAVSYFISALFPSTLHGQSQSPNIFGINFPDSYRFHTGVGHIFFSFDAAKDYLNGDQALVDLVETKLVESEDHSYFP